MKKPDEIIQKLLVIAYDDMDLVDRAIKESGSINSGSSLENVVDYVLKYRGSRWNAKAEEMAKDGDKYYAAVTTGVDRKD